jgi:putative phosphoesterase
MLLPGGAGRIAVVADTHSKPHPEAVRLLGEQQPVAILHAGDIGDRATALEPLRAVAPLHAIRGNIDDKVLPDTLVLDVTDALKLYLVHIGQAGVRLRADVARAARAAGAKLVVCGHSHVPFVGVEGNLTVFNPGSIGPRRFALPIVFGIIDVSPAGVRFAHISCETGKRWLPPGT